MQLRVGGDKLGADLRAPATRRASRPPLHHPSKCGALTSAEHLLPDDLCEAVRHVEAVELKDAARLWRPPRDGVHGPGKDSAAVGQQQPRRGQVSPNRHQPLAVSQLWPGKPQPVHRKGDGHDQFTPAQIILECGSATWSYAASTVSRYDIGTA